MEILCYLDVSVIVSLLVMWLLPPSNGAICVCVTLVVSNGAIFVCDTLAIITHFHPGTGWAQACTASLL